MIKILNNFFETRSQIIIKNFDVHLCNILLVLIILLPISLITGPFIPDLTIVLSTIFFLYLTFKYKLFKYFNNFIIKFLLLFWIYLVFSSLISESYLFSLKSSFFYIRFIIFSCFVYFLIDNYKNFKKLFMNCLVIAFSFVILDSLYQYSSGESLFGNDKPNLRLTGPFGDRQIVGSYLSRLSVLLFFLYYFFPFKINIKFLVLTILIILTVLLSGERASLFFITFIFLGISFLLFSFKKFLLSFLLYSLLITALINSIPSLKERLITQTIKGLAISKSYVETKNQGEKEYFNNKPKKGFYIFSKGHEAHYSSALSIFIDNKIFGAGPNMFRKICSDPKHFKLQQSCTTHPHNFMMQILAETGVVGAIFFIFTLIFFAKNCIKYIYVSIFNNKIINLKNTKTFILNLGFFTNIFIIFLPNGNFFNNYLCATIFLPLGFHLNHLNDNK